MKKLTLNSSLNHKAHGYEPLQIEVEKVITLYGDRFERLKNHTLDYVPEIQDNKDLMHFSDFLQQAQQSSRQILQL